MVETARVELASKSISPGFSPSAVNDLVFRIHGRPLTSFRIIYPVRPCAYGSPHKGSPYSRRQYSHLRVNVSWRAVQTYAAIAKVLGLLAFIFRWSCLRRTDQPPLAYPASTPLSKPLRPRVSLFPQNIMPQIRQLFKENQEPHIFSHKYICFKASFLLYYIHG